MVRIYTMYHPLRMFGYIGILLGLVGLVPIVRFLYFYFFESGAGHIQSLILGGIFLLMGFVTMLVALLADLINFNRRLIESTLQKVRSLEYERGSVARAVSEDQPSRSRKPMNQRLASSAVANFTTRSLRRRPVRSDVRCGLSSAAGVPYLLRDQALSVDSVQSIGQ